MADTSAGGDGFFAYYRQYARSGIHGASAAALTAIGLWASFTGNRWFILLAIAVYVLPPILLYLTGEGENVPSVVGSDEHESDHSGGTDGGTDRHGADSATARDSEVDNAGSTGETHTESDAIGDESATRTTDTSADNAGATAVGRSTERSETDESTPETDSAPSEPEPTAGRDASSQREPDEGPSRAGHDSTADDTAATGEPESAVEEADVDGHDGAVESVVEDSGADENGAEPGWATTDTPTDESLLDVVATHDGAYAVGESGVVLARDEEWEVALDDGPTTNANALRGVDATDDGEAVWFAGDSGVLGRYADGTLTDHSAPEDQTSTWADVAVTGEVDDERIHLVNGSGELLRGEFEDGSVSWGDIEKPGSGSSIAAIEFLDSDRGHLADTNQCVYETTDGGETYERIGIEDANAAFTGVAATDSTVVVAGDDGSVFRYDGAVWTPLQVGGALSAIALTDETGLATGDGGAVCELTAGSWETVETPTDADLRGIAIGTDDSKRIDIAVGTDGTVIERQR